MAIPPTKNGYSYSYRDDEKFLSQNHETPAGVEVHLVNENAETSPFKPSTGAGKSVAWDFIEENEEEEEEQSIPTRSMHEKIHESEEQTRPRRKGVIIISHGRSGSSYTFHFFNKNPLVFAAHEPLLMVERLKRKIPHLNETEAVIDILHAFMTCTFSKSLYGKRFLEEYSENYRMRFYSEVLKSPPFCDSSGNRDTCKALVPEEVDKVCLQKKYTAVKILYLRMPSHSMEVLFHVLRSFNTEVDLRIIQLFRDPRGNINSRIRLGLMKGMENNTYFPTDVQRECDMVEKNVRIGQELAKMYPYQFYFLRYKDIASTPLQTALDLYFFTGLKLTTQTVHWVQTFMRPQRVEAWRKESPKERTEIIEKRCQSLFDLLNIDSTIK